MWGWKIKGKWQQDWGEDGARSCGERKDKEMVNQVVWAQQQERKKENFEKKGGEEKGGMSRVE